MKSVWRRKTAGITESLNIEGLRDRGGAARAGQQRVAELTAINREVREKCVAEPVSDTI